MLDYGFLFNYLQLWRSYAILSATTQRAFRSMVDILSTLWWSRLIWHNFVKVAASGTTNTTFVAFVDPLSRVVPDLLFQIDLGTQSGQIRIRINWGQLVLGITDETIRLSNADSDSPADATVSARLCRHLANNFEFGHGSYDRSSNLRSCAATYRESVR